jgi:hypothetical protein
MVLVVQKKSNNSSKLISDADLSDSDGSDSDDVDTVSESDTNSETSDSDIDNTSNDKNKNNLDDNDDNDDNDEDVVDVVDDNLTKKENMIMNIKKVLSKKELYYFKMVDRYFKQCTSSNIKKMLNIINGDSEISLRILDWFVTRYSNKYKITINNGNDDDNIFNVHISYKAQLKSYKKKYFDPFRRRKKFVYKYSTPDFKKSIYTTIGQLNFFRWAINNKIIDYVEKYFNNIIKAMNKSNKDDKKKKKDKKDKKDKKEVSNKSADTQSSKSSNIKSIGVKPTNAKVVKLDKQKLNGFNVNATKKINNNEMQIILDFD